MDLDHRLSSFQRGSDFPLVIQRRRQQRRCLPRRTPLISLLLTLLITLLLTTKTTESNSSLKSHQRFDFAAFNNNHRRQHQQQSLPVTSGNNNHHFQRQQLNSGDPLYSIASSNSGANVNANFNQHFTRPYIRSPSLSSATNFFSTHQRNGAAASSLYASTEPACGYDSCHETNPNSLNIHVVCHTHLDTGWVETYDEYYHHYVKTIYDSVVATLSERPERKFIAVETSFFSRWYNDVDDLTRAKVHRLVRTGQMEFINGAWSMNDEASCHYQDIIDQFTYGHRWLNQTFGVCGQTKIGWQIDPFGHSREMASLFSQMGMDGLFLGRIDYQDKLLREKLNALEMIWKASPSLGNKADIFTGVLPNVYWPPQGFCWDRQCYDDTIDETNARKKALDFIYHARQQATKYGTNHTIITMGMDFYFRDAPKWYNNLDRLMREINSMEREQNVRIFYSTPSCYLKSLHDLKKKWSVKLDDFFPYADAFNTYWSGYFTSRPSQKYHIRYANNILQVSKQLNALVGMTDARSQQKLKVLQEALGILQHHDAVTGTSKQYVADDYRNMLRKGIAAAEESIGDAYDRLWIKEGYIPTSTTMSFCNLLNASRCDITESLGLNSDVVVIIYNPVAHPVKHYVRLPVKGSGHRVRDSAGVDISSQIVPQSEGVLSLPEKTAVSPAYRFGLPTSDNDLVFRVMLPPLGFTSIAIDRPDGIVRNPSGSTSTNHHHLSVTREGNHFQASSDPEFMITNGKFSAVFDSQTGLLQGLILKDGRRVPFGQNFFVYDAEGRKMGEKPSGAYAFNPASKEPRTHVRTTSFKVVKGPLVEEVHQVFSPWISQVVRIYQHVDYLEFDWVVGPIPIDNWFSDPGQEVVSRYMTDLSTNGTFFTDSNARETIRRVRDHRPTWDLDTTEMVASNYYPITGWMFIRDYDRDLQLTILPDRPEGGSSLRDGQLEMMVHRRLTMDDGFGMEEALNEPGEDGRGLIARGKHRIVFADIQESVRQMRMMSKSINLKPVLSFRQRDLSAYGSYSRPRATSQLANSKFIGLNKKLPPNINLLTLEPWDDNRVLLRLEHIFEVNEDSKYSRPRRLSLRDLFTTFIIVDAVEMTLDASREKRLAEATRLKFHPEVDPYANYTNVLTQVDNEDLADSTSDGGESPATPSFTIVMYPMEIRTFLVKYVERTNCVYTTSGLSGRGTRNRLRTPNC